MRNLQAINIDLLLEEQLFNYLHRKSYETLRRHCLTMVPIQPVVNDLTVILTTAAEEDKRATIEQLKPFYSTIQIKTETNKIDVYRDLLIAQLKENCHLTFLISLEQMLNNNRENTHLEHNEKLALSRILTQIRQHLIDRTVLTDLERALKKSQLTLSNQEIRRQAIINMTPPSNDSNQAMARENDRLLFINVVLANHHMEKLATRHQMARAALYATGIAGAAYVLQATLLMTLAPAVMAILTGVSGAIIGGLLLASAISWIQAAITQSKIDRNHQTIEKNEQQIQTMLSQRSEFLKTQLPQIDAEITRLKQMILTEKGRVEQAQATARASLITAESITVNRVTMSHNNTNAFFQEPRINQSAAIDSNRMYGF